MSEEQQANQNGAGHGDPGGYSTDASSETIAEARELERTFRALSANILLARTQWARQAGLTFDGARDEYAILGYDRVITTSQYRAEYDRGGIAGRIVDVMPDATWRGMPAFEVVEDDDPEVETTFEKAWLDLETKHQISAKLQRVDKLSRLSSFAVLLIGASGQLETELPRGNPSTLLYLMPFSGGGGPRNIPNAHIVADETDASVWEYESDTSNPRFGLPKTYRIRRTDISSANLARPVHWTRILHVAEGLLDDEVFGMPALERVWNLLIDLRKVTGGGAEAFWLRANQGLHVDVDKDMSLPDATSTIEKLKAQVDAYKHGIDRWLRTRGVKVQPLGSDVANFGPPADAVITQIAGAKGIPKRILTGSEMGELASSQDRDNFKDLIVGRQSQYAGPSIVRPLVDRLVAYGYLPTPGGGPLAYEVKWPHVQTLTEDERAAGAAKWAEVNKAAGSIVFTEQEIRDKWYGLAPTGKDLEDLQPWRAELALKMANVNKTQGAIVFTDDEIRDTCYGWKPLTPEERIPVTAPERVSVTAPTPEGELAPGQQPVPAKGAPSQLTAAEDGELLRVLTAAVHAKNFTVVRRVLGLQQAHTYATTQVQLPERVAQRVAEIGRRIADSDLYEPEGGRETDLHVTVKYGLVSPDPLALAQVPVVMNGNSTLLGRAGKVRALLGKTAFFSTLDYDVVYVAVVSEDLAALNRAIGAYVQCAPSEHSGYVPHATVAYVKSGAGQKYADDASVDGLEFVADRLTLVDMVGARTEVPLV